MKNKKIVVFDLDQTLGDFGQLSMFLVWTSTIYETKIKRT